MTCKNLFFFVCFFSTQLAFGQLDIVSGNVGIGTTTPTEKLVIYDIANNSPGFVVDAGGQNFVKAAAGASGAAFFYKANAFFALIPGNDTSADQFAAKNFFVSGVNGRTCIGCNSGQLSHINAQLVVDGDIVATGNITPSDIRIKKNINTYENGLAAILQLQPIQFEYNGKGGTNNGSSHIGLKAQEVAKAAPNMVTEFKYNVTEDITFDKALPEVFTNTETYLAIKDSEIKYLLINAIKEQQAQLDQQQQLIETLQKEIVGLKK